MTIYTGDDTTHGKSVVWYMGGVVASETITITEADVTATYKALEAKAEWGSIFLKVGSTITAPVQYAGATGGELATDSSGVLSISYAGMAADDVVTISYLDISTTALSEVAMSQDVKTSWKAEETSETVHGQANKIKMTGAVEQTADIAKIMYTQDFIAAFMGDQVSDAAGNKFWTTKYNAFKKVGALVGIKTDTSGAVEYKWFLYGVEPSSADEEFANSGFYKQSLSLNVDDHSEFQVASA